MFKSKLKKWLGNGVTVLLLVIGLVLWISLPWIGVLAVAVLVALWLLLTRGGRLALAATRIGVASLPQRWGASSVIVVGIAGVVGVLVAMLAMGEGFQATLNNTGDDTTAIVLRGGSQAETNSVITREQVPTLSTLPGISRDAQGRPLLSPELSQVVNLVSKSDGTDVNAQF
ncbi:MAG: ABC transporter permease, partial [Stenotrophomonas sp.]|nr:ABC transporter permease [Stenotrophomonas sp.]